MKTCRNPDCTQANPQELTQFMKRVRGKGGLNSRCKTCVNVVNRLYVDINREKINKRNQESYHKSPAKHKQKARLCRFRTKYWPHLTIKEVEATWNKMYEEQQGRCSICSKKRLLEVEHCHKTGKVRSLACNSCNVALARMYENVEIARSIIAYIEKHNT